MDKIIETVMEKYPKKSFEYAVVAVDVVLFTVVRNKLHALLLELDREEFPNMWALPGGLVAPNEKLEQAAERHLRERANATNAHIEQLATFGDPDRDPTGWVVSVAYMGLIAPHSFSPKTSTRYKSIEWYPVDELPSLAYDHQEIIKTAVERLQGKLSYTNIIYSLVPEEFTLSELQNSYEIILEKELDKRNFRKKFLSLDLLEELPKKASGGAHRPAVLYRFTEKTPQIISIL